MQPIWKLYGNGSVGSQALLGIPYVAALRNDPTLDPISRVWPFETGLRRLSGRASRDWLILHAEIYPSLLPIRPTAGEVKDAVQVRMMANHFAGCDEAETLDQLFLGCPLLSPEDREKVEFEEGWTLGVTQACMAQPRLHPTKPESVSATERVPVQSRSNRARSGRRTELGYVNRNRQIVIRSTGLPGTDYGQYIYVLCCEFCGNEYGANGSDIHVRRCPACQGGRPGLSY